MEAVLPKVETIRNADEYNLLVERGQSMLSQLKPLDYSVLRGELKELNFTLSESPSLQQLNFEIQRIQGAKDRVTEILMDATNDNLMRGRICDILTEGWARFSSESSADKRKADASVRFSQFLMMAVEAESFYKTVVHVMKNLDYKHESASRRVTCFNLTLKLRDIRRGTPDRDYALFSNQEGQENDDWAERSDVPT